MKTSITQKYSDIRTFNVDRCSDSSQRHRRERRVLSWRSSSTKCCRLMSDAGTARKGKPVHTDTDALFKQLGLKLHLTRRIITVILSAHTKPPHPDCGKQLSVQSNRGKQTNVLHRLMQSTLILIFWHTER